MGMGIQMFFTIFVISITFGAEPELHVGAVHFRSATDSAFMLRNTAASLSDFPLKLLSSLNLLRLQVHSVSGCEEKDNKVKHGGKDNEPGAHTTDDKLIRQQDNI